MRSLEKVIDYVKSGSVLVIKEPDVNFRESGYNSYIMKYDGRIFEDVIIAEISDVLSLIPNIQEQLNKGYSCHVIYDIEKKQYQSSVIRPIKNSAYKNLTSDQIVKEFQVSNENFLDSIIDLDTKILNINSENLIDKNLKKELVS